MTGRSDDDPSESFVPTVSCQLKIVVNEGNALMQIHDSEDKELLKPLLKLPTKSIDTLRSLNFALEHLEELKDKFIDLLVVVTFVIINCITGSSVRKAVREIIYIYIFPFRLVKFVK